MLLLVLPVLCCRLSFVTHWGSHIFYGLNAGAALAVVAASALGLAFPAGRPLLASTGGALLFLLILLLSSAGRSGLTPMKVTFCGVALSAFVSPNNGCNPDS
ncbi:iron chelate uptake ABC transporter family permease subunit [Escherichia coli]